MTGFLLLPDLKKALTFIDAFLATALRAIVIVAPEDELSLDDLRFWARPRAVRVGETGTAGANDESIKSLRTFSGLRGELVGRLNAGLGGDSLSGAGRRRAGPFGLVLNVGDGDDVASGGLFGEPGVLQLRGKATSRKVFGFA